jgi:hypothetical protein
VDADPVYDADSEAQQLLLRPLFFTSFLIDDFVEDSGLLDQSMVVLSSASSKTASSLAFLLSRREDVFVVGLTSARSAQFARDLGVYDEIVLYDDIDSLPQRRAVFVDMAGDALVRESVHRRLADDLIHSAVVGATHHDRMGELPADLPGAHPQFFFAPDRVVKRSEDWGAEELERRIADAWKPFLGWTSGWLDVVHGGGEEAVKSAYLDVLDGRIDPSQAHVLSLTA